MVDQEAWPVDTNDEVEVEMQNLLLQSSENDNKQEDVRISLHAIGEARSLDLIRIQGKVNGVPVTALVDSGSTHSFVDPKVVEKAGLKVSETKPMEITVANGSKMFCDKKCDGFTWVMQGQEFQYDIKIMEIGTYEMLLGGDWMKKVRPVLLDMGSSTLTMVRDGKKVVFQGLKDKGNVHVVNNTEVVELLPDEQCMLIQAFPCDGEEKAMMLPAPLTALVENYPEIFQEPKQLPPKRSHDHAIPLKEGAELSI